MAFDGLIIANIRKELSDKLTGGRLYKIAQPEADELLLTIKTTNGQYRLSISANASLPLIYFIKDNKPSPLTAPNFCMLLRKYVNNARIISITQPGLERILDFELEHFNELGDICHKHLIAEFMGKYSNIIFCDNNNMILDSIKHVSSQMSSVREVLPGRPYFIPNTTDKGNPLATDYNEFVSLVCSKPQPLCKAIYLSYTGISPAVAEEICYQASLEDKRSALELNENERLHLYHIFSMIFDGVKNGNFEPNIFLENGEPKDFSAIKMTMYNNCTYYASVSDVLNDYYSKKEIITRIRQKSSDLRRIVTTNLERSIKKYNIQKQQLKDTEKRDKYRVYGELINTYGYNIPKVASSFEALNYYTNEMITIPLDCTLTPKENAVKYFNRYNKLKRTFEAENLQIKETSDDITYLESISNALDIAVCEDDLYELKQELIQSGYIHAKGHTTKKSSVKGKPLHYISSDGFDIFVGKNNLQNEELTFKLANGNDWWFHAKEMPGSHVIVKTNGKELPDRTFEEAASLAAYYSKGRSLDKVEIDYVLKKEVKKPAASKPGFVIYYTNYSMMASTDISSIKEAIESY